MPELKGGEKNSVRMNHTYMGEISDNDFTPLSCKTFSVILINMKFRNTMVKAAFNKKKTSFTRKLDLNLRKN
jgi:hypothetical protein